MFIVTTSPKARPSSVGAARIRVRSGTSESLIGSEISFMPLLRSLADSAARVAINMALLAELFASLQPPRVKDTRQASVCS